MKYLSEYVAEGQTKAFDRAGAFFAFSDEQFNKSKKEGVVYTHLMAGLICPKDKADALLLELASVHKAGVEQDIAENGIEGIVKRELNNHEAYYTGDISSTVEALEMYDISTEDIRRIFHNKNYVIETK